MGAPARLLTGCAAALVVVGCGARADLALPVEEHGGAPADVPTGISLGGMQGGGGAGTDPGLALDCPGETIATQRVKSNVVLLVDASDSMFTTPFDGAASPISALERALFADEDGVFNEYQDRIAFHFSAFGGGNACDAVLGNDGVVAGDATAFTRVLSDAHAGQSNSTRPAAQALRAALEQWDAGGDDASEISPTVRLFVVSDGAPTSCASEAEQPSCMDMIDAYETVFEAGAELSIVFVGEQFAQGVPADWDYVEPVAGECQTGPDGQSPVLSSGVNLDRASATDELGRAVRSIAEDRSCVFSLEYPVSTSTFAERLVELAGEQLQPELDYRLLDALHLELLGTACETSWNEPDSTLTLQEYCAPGVIR